VEDIIGLIYALKGIGPFEIIALLALGLLAITWRVLGMLGNSTKKK
jgi:hypothetical protein